MIPQSCLILAVGLAHQALDAISLNGCPHAPAGRESNLDRRIVVHFWTGHQSDDQADTSMCNSPNVVPGAVEKRPDQRAPLEPKRTWESAHSGVAGPGMPLLARARVTYTQILPALRAAAGEHFPTILRRHARPKTMLVRPLAPARLIRTLHSSSQFLCTTASPSELRPAHTR